jgi:hypothetical protein
MGSGRRTDHQHHHVHPGTPAGGGAATAGAAGALVTEPTSADLALDYDTRLRRATLLESQIIPTLPPPPAPSANERCARCGQFVGATTHHCPLDTIPYVTRHTPTIGMLMPDPHALPGTVNFAGGVLLPVRAAVDDPRIPSGGHLVAGEVRIAAPLTHIDHDDLGARLFCSCGISDCRHARQVATAVLDQVVPDHRQRATASRRAATTVLTELAADHQASQRAHQASIATAADAGSVSYLDDFDAFQQAYRQARRRHDAGEPAVPLLLEDATGGLGARGFGVELEFDFEGGTSRTALRRIASDLRDAGLSQHSEMLGYHQGRRDGGYTAARDGWRLEADSTVAGEIVSPILFDSPQTWTDVQTVCDIVRQHGGIVSRRTGGHVHVGTANFDHEVGHHNRLLHLVDTHTDTLFRLAANPVRGRHRGLFWCSPSPAPANGYATLTQARDYNYSHNYAINLGGVHGRASDHVEYRMWDSSLDPAIIQTQVKLSLGLTEAAFRTSAQPRATTDIERVGQHWRAVGGRGRGARLRGEEWRSSTRSFRALVDTVFHRSVDKAQATGLFAITRWQRG